MCLSCDKLRLLCQFSKSKSILGNLVILVLDLLFKFFYLFPQTLYFFSLGGGGGGLGGTFSLYFWLFYFRFF